MLFRSNAWEPGEVAKRAQAKETPHDRAADPRPGRKLESVPKSPFASIRAKSVSPLFSLGELSTCGKVPDLAPESSRFKNESGTFYAFRINGLQEKFPKFPKFPICRHQLLEARFSSQFASARESLSTLIETDARRFRADEY